MFRKASANDIDEITSLYMDVHTEEEAGRMSTGWIRSVYPTRKTVEDNMQMCIGSIRLPMKK